MYDNKQEIHTLNWDLRKIKIVNRENDMFKTKHSFEQITDLIEDEDGNEFIVNAEPLIKHKISESLIDRINFCLQHSNNSRLLLSILALSFDASNSLDCCHNRCYEVYNRITNETSNRRFVFYFELSSMLYDGISMKAYFSTFLCWLLNIEELAYIQHCPVPTNNFGERNTFLLSDILKLFNEESIKLLDKVRLTEEFELLKFVRLLCKNNKYNLNLSRSSIMKKFILYKKHNIKII